MESASGSQQSRAGTDRAGNESDATPVADSPVPDSRVPTTAIVIALYALLALIVIPVFPHFGSPNEFTRWALAASVFEEHSVEVSRAATLLGPQFEDLAVVDGRQYSNKAPGTAIVASPGYLLARPFAGPPSAANLRAALTCMRWFGATLPLLLMAFAFGRAARTRGGDPALAVAAMLFATPLFAYGLLLFSHALTSAALFGAWLLLYLRDRGGVMAGVLIGIAVASEYPTVAPALVLVIGLLAQRAWGRVARVVAGGAPFALLLALYQKLAFGSILASPYSYEKVGEYRALAHTGVFGLHAPDIAILSRLLFDPSRGLLVFAPVIAAALFALPAARRALPRATFVTLLLTPAALIAVYAGYPNWHGGWNVGPRYIVGAIPFLLFPLAFARGRRITAILLGASAAAVVPITLTFPFPDRSFAMPWSTLAWPLLRDGLVAPNLLHLVARPLAVAVPFAIVVTAIAFATKRNALLAALGAVLMFGIGALAPEPALTQRLRLGYIEEVYFEQKGAMTRAVGGLPVPPRAIERARAESVLPPTSWPF
ncbi:MAG: hypothetical protein QOC81_4097 [Thermoanaerobaculia bacterium]|jgi:hypothetical protein|nr:hypothetical protein [Thermoanaerobaculia bacterium]